MGVSDFPGEKNVTKMYGSVLSNFQKKKCYVTLELSSITAYGPALRIMPTQVSVSSRNGPALDLRTDLVGL